MWLDFVWSMLAVVRCSTIRTKCKLFKKIVKNSKCSQQFENVYQFLKKFLIKACRMFAVLCEGVQETAGLVGDLDPELRGRGLFLDQRFCKLKLLYRESNLYRPGKLRSFEAF